MPSFRRLLPCAFLMILGGCAPSLDGPRQPRVTRGGFSVLVDGAGRPASARVVADIGSFALARGLVRQSALPGPPEDPVTRESLPTAPERYLRGSVELDVSYQPATHRVTAYLHSSGPGSDRRFMNGFYHDFDRAYAGRYGSDDPISESGYADDSGGPSVADRPPGASVTGPGGGPSDPGNPMEPAIR